MLITLVGRVRKMKETDTRKRDAIDRYEMQNAIEYHRHIINESNEKS